MDQRSLSDRYGAFYAPTVSVRIDNKDLMRQYLIPVAQAEADLVLGGSARFSFTVSDTYDFKDHRFISGEGMPVLDLLSFGARLEIRMGYGDSENSDLPLIMRGVVTEISTSFPEAGAPELVIAGYDHAFPMTGGKSSRSWSQALDSAAVQEIAAFHNLGTQIVATRVRQAQIEQNQESDFEFIKKLAQRNDYELYVDDSGKSSVLRFAPPNHKGDSVLELAWGTGLLSFKPSANLAGQVSAVEVHGWDSQRARPIIGRAGNGDLTGLTARQRGVPELFGNIVRDSAKLPVLRLRQPVFTQAEADQRAKAALNESARQFLTGEAEALGLPQIRPDRNITLSNLGAPFSKTYYIEQATHKVDSNGYRTRFKIKESGL